MSMDTRRLRRYLMMILLFGFGSGCTAIPPCSPPPTTPSSALEQRIKDQDKRIAELTTQLNMLKHIDQGRMKER